MNPNVESKLDGDVLKIRIVGFLDLRCNVEFDKIVDSFPHGCRRCDIDLYDVDRVFDSGLAVLMLLIKRLTRSKEIQLTIVGSAVLQHLIKPLTRSKGIEGVFSHGTIEPPKLSHQNFSGL